MKKQKTRYPKGIWRDQSKARYPIREYLGKFESWILVMKGSSCVTFYDRVLENFFKAFPKKLGIEQITSLDIADWVALRQQRGIEPRTLSYELSVLMALWNWLIQDRGAALQHPVRAFKKNRGIRGYYVSSYKGKWSLSDIERLLNALTDVEAKKTVLGVMRGERLRRRKVRQTIHRAAQQIGLQDFSLAQLKPQTRSRLALDMVQAYVERALRDIESQKEESLNHAPEVQSPCCISDTAIP